MSPSVRFILSQTSAKNTKNRQETLNRQIKLLNNEAGNLTELLLLCR